MYVITCDAQAALFGEGDGFGNGGQDGDNVGVGSMVAGGEAFLFGKV
jgi:hypothetical protein